MIARTFALAVGLMAGTAASQLPEFAQQYRQRLGGTIDELARSVTRFDADARSSGMTRDDAIRSLKASPETFPRLRAQSEIETEERLKRLEDHRDAMKKEGSFGRLASFLRYGDAGLSAATMNDFEPAVPVTTEGVAAASLGFLGGYFLVRICAAPFGRRRPRGAAKSARA